MAQNLGHLPSEPGVLVTSFMHTYKRFTEGKKANTELETKLFKKFARVSPPAKAFMQKGIKSFVSKTNRKKKSFAFEAITQTAKPLSAKVITNTFINELTATVASLALDKKHPDLVERPGRVRLQTYTGDDVYPSQVHIFKIGNVRTNDNIPLLKKGDFLPEEFQQICTPRENQGKIKWDCKTQKTPCDGYSIDRVCLKVPQFQAGTSVTLTGMNYFNIEAKVELKLQNAPTQPIAINAFVYGDTTTPKYETKRGKQLLIADSRVQDKIFFTVPENTPSGIYEIKIAIPNNSGLSGPGIFDTMYSIPQYIEVVPPNTSRFNIASERLYCRDETGRFDWTGSDKVGLQFTAIPILSDLSIGNFQQKKFRFDDVDSQEQRTMEGVLFSNTKPIAGVILSITGHEIDGKAAYRESMEEWTDIFIDLVKEQWKLITGSAAAMATIKKLTELGFYGYLTIAIGLLVITAIDFIYSLWASPDLIIEDIISLSANDLGRLTSINFPAPIANSNNTIYTTPGGIDVRLFYTGKVPNEYTEERAYISKKEKSWYNVRLRYNRIP